jgi:hypothetical protein
MTQLARRLSSTTPASATASVTSSSGVDSYKLSSLISIVIKLVGTIMKALKAELSLDKFWIVDSGASKHMTPYPVMFKTYKSMSERDKLQTADDSLCSIAGVGDVTCTSELQLSLVLYVSNFTNNLLSVSLVDNLNYVVSISYSCCVTEAEDRRGN